MKIQNAKTHGKRRLCEVQSPHYGRHTRVQTFRCLLHYGLRNCRMSIIIQRCRDHRPASPFFSSSNARGASAASRAQTVSAYVHAMRSSDFVRFSFASTAGNNDVSGPRPSWRIVVIDRSTTPRQRSVLLPARMPSECRMQCHSHFLRRPTAA